MDQQLSYELGQLDEFLAHAREEFGTMIDEVRVIQEEKIGLFEEILS